MIIQTDDIYVVYEKCYKDNLHSIWASQEVYRRGKSKEEFIRTLSNNIRPVYDSALRQDYNMWQFETKENSLIVMLKNYSKVTNAILSDN